MTEQTIQLGDRIKNLRLKKELTIEGLAERSGLAAASISEMENHQLSPPLGDIVKLANSLHVSVGDLFGDSADAPFCIVRSGSRKSVSRFSSASRSAGGYSYESLGYQKQNRHMEPFLVTLTPTPVPQTVPNRHAGEEILFVLEGQVEVSLAEHTDILNPGDSIYYDSNLPHIVSCHGDRPARLMAVIYAEKEMHIF